MVRWLGHGPFKCVGFPVDYGGVRASDLKCSCATLVHRPVLILEIKKLSNIKVSHKVSQGIETNN